MLKTLNKQHFINNKFFYGLLLLGFLLRVIGIDYGYPYVFNIDEPTIVRSTLGLRYTPEIGHFDWPHFTFYFNYIFYFVFIKLRGLAQALNLRESLESLFPILWNDPFIFYFITRFINALFGLLTVVPTYLLARDMLSKRIALIATAIFVVTPYHIYISHVGTPDVLLLFFLAWAIYFSYKFSVNLSYKNAILAGLMYGIASSIKYNAVIFAVILLLFVFYRLKLSNRLDVKNIKPIFIKLVVFGFAALFGLLATTPTIITDWDVFWSYEYGKGFLWQLTENSGPLGLAQYPAAVLEQVTKIVIDTGVIIPLLFIFGIYKASQKSEIKENRISIYISAGVTIGFILFMSRYSRSTSHYFLPMYSLLIIVAAYGLSFIKSKVLLGPIFALLFVYSVWNMMLFVRDDTQNDALKYYEESKNKGGKTYIEGNNLSETDMMNNLNMKKAKNGFDLTENDVVITQTAIENNDKIELVETIGNFFRKGPILYVYKKAI